MRNSNYNPENPQIVLDFPPQLGFFSMSFFEIAMRFLESIIKLVPMRFFKTQL